MKGPYLILLWVPRAWTKALENKRKRFKEGAKVSSVRSECVKGGCEVRKHRQLLKKFTMKEDRV